MTRSWNGYLVRALNEFASLAASFRDTDPSHRIPTPSESFDRSSTKAKEIVGHTKETKTYRAECCPMTCTRTVSRYTLALTGLVLSAQS